MFPIVYIEETNSTNSYLKELLQKEKPIEGTIVVTNNQTAGRGQKGNSWESEKGKNLTFSMVLYPAFVPITEQFVLSQITSLAIKELLDRYTSHISIKWPNDIYWQDKKIAGILIENILSEEGIESCIIGVGLNVNQTKFNSDAPNPTSLKIINGRDYDLESMLKLLRTIILLHYYELRDNYSCPIVDKYKNSLFRKEGYHLYNDGEKNFEARIKDILPTGHLVLETVDGEERVFAFKEVKFVLD